jgi:hypothetical protein
MQSDAVEMSVAPAWWIRRVRNHEPEYVLHDLELRFQGRGF